MKKESEDEGRRLHAGTIEADTEDEAIRKFEEDQNRYVDDLVGNGVTITGVSVTDE